ncbi:zinc-dependent peptidase [Legionella bononiensis]|uniref:Zinc-dependent peptidase n=1 Tax=Legionella bononiensis TaxID=2793102 RepID=A0ABS1WC60_9GAMM|nr:M90 family metallopeptidase [Legionella bononiensis]MBL7479173.1 zinc-dependent peptidase [Legionella bononiensis]MBL7526909.1 zinc-dependent peptidase [Legionella bononiensis]MBL7563823.1 zinc-dependent peptidase [Legionella bononiensis]
MFQWLQEWWQERIVRRSLITNDEWNVAFQNLPLLHRLSDQEKARLKRLAILFLYYKTLEGVGDLKITTAMQLTVALQACLLILNLGLHWYDGWVSVVIYPGAFSRQSREVDEFGIEHLGRTNLSGESWQRGPVILSWNDAVHHGEIDGHNVVIHEFAHKLDMRNGRANGFPPLHKGMSAQQWAEEFNKAYFDFGLRIQQHNPIPIDHYAIESAGEFFAVFTELFFEKPIIIKDYYPAIYDLLVLFYRQNPVETFI